MRTDEILAAYTWATGDCFKCASLRLPTTRVGEIDTRSGEHYDVRACEACVLVMERERQRWLVRRGTMYRPGVLGAP